MSHLGVALEISACTLAVLWLGLGLLRSPRRPLEQVWLVFCASMALFLLKRLGGESLGAWQFLIGLGACFTCNAFWLVARGLFRPGQAIGLAPVLFALGIALLLMLRQLLLLAVTWSWCAADTGQRLAAALGELSGLLSSTVLMLAFWEALRGWTACSLGEQRMRSLFLGAYGACVLGSSVVPHLYAPAQRAAAEALLESAAALLILLVAQALVWWRLRQPELADPAPAEPEAQASTAPSRTAEAPRADEPELAARLEALVRQRRLYLEPELKLVHLAQALNVSEYRVSRAINTLGARNFNRWLNAWRVAHAQTLLRDPALTQRSILELALEAGFASLGPFNRAFKDLTGQTPGSYRQDGRRDETVAQA